LKLAYLSDAFEKLVTLNLLHGSDCNIQRSDKLKSFITNFDLGRGK
jgi:hypothetical protein